MQRVLIAPTALAGNRTKNRLRDHGPSFVIVKAPQVPVFDRGGMEWVLVKDAKHTKGSFGISGSISEILKLGTGWHGWLPCTEIKMTKV